MGKKMRDTEQETNKRKREKENEEGSECDLNLRCEWADCTFMPSTADELVQHVEAHQPHSETRESNGKQAEWYCCMWELCGFNSLCWRTARFHINYHGFHTHIKALGAALLKQQPDLDCHLDLAGRNILPVLPDERSCEWRDCSFSSDSYLKLLQHANTHVTGQPRRRNNQIVYCEWQDCNRANSNMTKLKSHLRSHTQEKVIACPVCGVQFASKTKLIDHCGRQVSPEKKNCKCSYCKKSFHSERILQDHIRLHVNLHKCPMCDMTCPFRYTLALHIRYRHLSERPFKCTFCDHRAMTEKDLKTHYQSHCSENCWVCEQAGCDFSCRSKNGLSAHYAKVHRDSSEEYGCHICDARYDRGAALTVHLKTKHCYRWASGQSRFRYIKDEGGVHRLQTVRYESIEVTEQIMANANERRSNRPKRFTCVTLAPDKLIITQDNRNNSAAPVESDCDPDDPDQVEEEEIDDPESEASVITNTSRQQDTTDFDTESEFGKSLRKHLGLEEGFIQVVKTD